MPLHRSQANRVRAFLICAAVFFSVFALARPQWGNEKTKIERQGIDVLFLLDTSLSMLAEDIKPSRFEKSKLEIKSFLRKIKGDRVGMVAFAGSGYLQTPLTLDYPAFQLFLDGVKVGYIPDPGTSLEPAIEVALQSFPPKNLKHKAIILFSDGEDNEGGAERALEDAKRAGVRIYTIGVGSSQGEPIPLKDDQGRKSGFKKDSAGKVVMTKLNPQFLEKIAERTGGLYLPSTPGEDEIDLILKHMQSIGKTKFKEQIVTEKEEHFPTFLALALLFLAAESFVRNVNRAPRGNPAAMTAILAAFWLLSSGFLFDNSRSLNEKANTEYKNKKYQTALDLYQKAKVNHPDDPMINYNLGTALYKTNDYRQAEADLLKTIEKTTDNALKAQAYYNLGNTQYRTGNFEKAIESYQKALDLNPQDVDSKYNLEFLQKQKSMFDKKNQDRKKDQKQNQQNQQNQDQKQNQQKQGGGGQSDKQDQQKNQQNQQNQDQQQKDQQNQQNQDQQQKDQQNQQNQDQQQKDRQNQQNQDQQQKDQEKQQNQDQQQKDQQKQKDKDQQQKDQQNQQNQDQQQKDQQNQQNQDQQQKDQQKRQEEEQQRRDQQEKERQEREREKQRQEEQEQQQREEAERKEQEQREKEQKEDAEKNLPRNQKEQASQGGRRPLQGQMATDQALRLLDALKESEKELQDLRRPPVRRDQPTVEKDW